MAVLVTALSVPFFESTVPLPCDRVWCGMVWHGLFLAWLGVLCCAVLLKYILCFVDS